jgi:hypothetical protein
MLAPNCRITARRHAKQGRGLSRTSQPARLHSTRAICLALLYLTARRFLAMSDVEVTFVRLDSPVARSDYFGDLALG